MKRIVCASLALAPAVCAQAHHSFFGRIDTSATMELEGLVTRVVWRNPHAHFFLEVDQEGEIVD